MSYEISPKSSSCVGFCCCCGLLADVNAAACEAQKTFTRACPPDSQGHNFCKMCLQNGFEQIFSFFSTDYAQAATAVSLETQKTCGYIICTCLPYIDLINIVLLTFCFLLLKKKSTDMKCILNGNQERK